MFTTHCFCRRALSVSASLLLVGGAVLCSAPQAHAQGYFVGALLFAADANGTTRGGGYQFDTNTSSVAAPLGINNGGKGISFALANGSNLFSFDTGSSPISAAGGTVGDLGLFFSPTNTSYNPNTSSRTPDLIVARAINGATSFFTPSAGTAVNYYIYSGTTLANGANSFALGSSTITVSAYSVSDKPAGTFTIQVTPNAAPSTPEPGSIALLVGAGLSGSVFTFRRRRNRK